MNGLKQYAQFTRDEKLWLVSRLVKKETVFCLTMFPFLVINNIERKNQFVYLMIVLFWHICSKKNYRLSQNEAMNPVLRQFCLFVPFVSFSLFHYLNLFSNASKQTFDPFLCLFFFVRFIVDEFPILNVIFKFCIPRCMLFHFDSYSIHFVSAPTNCTHEHSHAWQYKTIYRDRGKKQLHLRFYRMIMKYVAERY